MLYSGDETCDVGFDSGTPVSDDYTSANAGFNGKIKWVQLDAGNDDRDHPHQRRGTATRRHGDPVDTARHERGTDRRASTTGLLRKR